MYMHDGELTVEGLSLECMPPPRPDKPRQNIRWLKNKEMTEITCFSI